MPLVLEDRGGGGTSPVSAAGDLIRQLEAGGMTQREIARRINRGPSYVSKVATGRKPGGGLEASLRALQRGAGSAHAPRRRTASGTIAAVRTSPTRPRSAPSGRSPAPRPMPAPTRADGSMGDRVRAGASADGMSGESPVAWRVRAYRDAGGWHDRDKGAGPITNPGSVEYVVLGIRGLDDEDEAYRQFSAFLTDDYDLFDLVADVLESYGVAE